jgi:3-methyladenine DNA glycosylase AlkD
MPVSRKNTKTRSAQKQPASIDDQVAAIVASLKSLGSKRIRDEMGPRYGIHTEKAFGVSMSNIQQVAKRVGRNHELALALWATGWYEARMLTSFVDEPDKVTASQMDRWCRDFDNWGICDTLCFNLFDQTPHAFRKIEQWSKKENEFVKRAAFALLACVALHNQTAGDEEFLRYFPIIERAAIDDRNFVKKGVSWALRLVGRRSLKLNVESVALSKRLVNSPEPAARWIGRAALKELTNCPPSKSSPGGRGETGVQESFKKRAAKARTKGRTSK